MNRKIVFAAFVLLLLGLGFLLIRVSSTATTEMRVPGKSALHTDVSNFPDTQPVRPLDLLFIHHSCGGQLLAAPGPESHANCVYQTSVNAGGLKAMLQQSGYIVHEASYASVIGQNTDIFDWLPKFRDKMDQVLACDLQDARLPEVRKNSIVVFKSCFPNNNFLGEGSAPGNPAGPDLTLWNAKATYMALLEEFKKHPDVLFVCVTAPPLAPRQPSQPLWKLLAKKALGRTHDPAKSARLARHFNIWLGSPDGWLGNGSITNVAVFNYYYVLTGNGASDLSLYATHNGTDSHPSREGNEKAAAAFVPFLNRAVHRAGLQVQ